MGQQRQKSHRCPQCQAYHVIPNRKVATWFRVDGADIQVCYSCECTIMRSLLDRLTEEKKAVRTIKDIGGKRVIILTSASDYVGDMILRPDNVKLVAQATAEDVKEVLSKKG